MYLQGHSFVFNHCGNAALCSNPWELHHYGKLQGPAVQLPCRKPSPFSNKRKLLPFSKVKQNEWDEWGCLLSDLDKETSWFPNAAHPKQEHVLAKSWCARLGVFHNSWLSCSSKHFIFLSFWISNMYMGKVLVCRRVVILHYTLFLNISFFILKCDYETVIVSLALLSQYGDRLL